MTVALGLPGFEIDLEQKSLIVSSVSVSDNTQTTASADQTLHIDILPSKKTFKLTYDIISKENWQSLVDIYDLQSSSLSSLSFKISESSGVVTYSVYMPPIGRGDDYRDKLFYKGTTITLVER